MFCFVAGKDLFWPLRIRKYVDMFFRQVIYTSYMLCYLLFLSFCLVLSFRSKGSLSMSVDPYQCQQIRINVSRSVSVSVGPYQCQQVRINVSRSVSMSVDPYQCQQIRINVPVYPYQCPSRNATYVHNFLAVRKTIFHTNILRDATTKQKVEMVTNQPLFITQYFSTVHQF